MHHYKRSPTVLKVSAVGVGRKGNQNETDLGVPYFTRSTFGQYSNELTNPRAKSNHHDVGQRACASVSQSDEYFMSGLHNVLCV